MKVYVNGMVIKSSVAKDHVSHGKGF